MMYNVNKQLNWHCKIVQSGALYLAVDVERLIDEDDDKTNFNTRTLGKYSLIDSLEVAPSFLKSRFKK